MKKLGKKQKLLIALAGLTALIIVVLQGIYVRHVDMESQRERANLNARVYSEELEMDFQQGISITETLKELIIANDGVINQFDTVASELMQKDIGSIQIAPGGVVTEIYPLKGNEKGLIDLMDDPERGPILQYSMDNDVVTMQGPFDLKQGGQGIAVRNPVFLEDENGDQTFWGFTIVIIRVPGIFGHTLEALESFDYDYCLETTVSPLSSEAVRVAASIAEDEELSDPAVWKFRAGACTWSMYVAPRKGWGSERLFGVITGGLAFVALITMMTYLLLYLNEQQKSFRRMAVTDELTGVFSRRGLTDKLDEIIREYPYRPLTAVFLDLDDFKLINDVHGHQIGDEALKNLARNLRESFPEESVIGRTGGDEFCVLIVGKTAEESMPKIRDAVAKDQTFRIGEKSYTYTLSAGYADYPEQAVTRNELMVLADQALYAAKMEGKHRCIRFHPAMAELKRSQLGFNVKSIAAGIPGAFLIYQAYEEERILFANEDLIHMMGCKNYEEFLKHTEGSFQKFVHPEDLERVESEVWTQVHAEQEREKKDGNQRQHYDDMVSYRIVTKDGTVKPVVDLGRLIHTENYGDIFFVFIREKDSLQRDLMS